MIGTCPGCGFVEPLFPDGLCDDCHYEREAEIADLDRDYADDLYDDEDWDDEDDYEPGHQVQDVRVEGGLL